MQIIVKHRNRFFAIALWSGATTIVMFWLVMRRAGFNTGYSRCSYLVMMGEYKQLLEAGTFPSNEHLPPHLRLDTPSYLDLPTTDIALPPLIDVSLSDKDQITRLESQLPSTERSDLNVHFGPIKTKTIIMTPSSNERYVRRRLGLSEKDRKKLAEEERRTHEQMPQGDVKDNG
ncbi:hypothetical protein ABL78_7765 [Leptomonas seymouri]|uniref:Uncharacterized protein n=1 Tax=Leptomonas seymouri TaxID=5684 RepID=A0A0N1PB87_LEPSE|nr:hypothetical protein ABL78_7765 [Leptomonas seymouri]|eukprot:KPI83208.1 hypothetical protein ABL78_7765 [Leptomonas seymouri]